MSFGENHANKYIKRWNSASPPKTYRDIIPLPPLLLPTLRDNSHINSLPTRTLSANSSNLTVRTKQTDQKHILTTNSTLTISLHEVSVLQGTWRCPQQICHTDARAYLGRYAESRRDTQLQLLGTSGGRGRVENSCAVKLRRPEDAGGVMKHRTKPNSPGSPAARGDPRCWPGGDKQAVF